MRKKTRLRFRAVRRAASVRRPEDESVPRGRREQLRVDAVEECLVDLRKTFTPLWYGNALPRDPTSGALAEGAALSEAQKNAALDAVVNAHAPARLRQIEALLGSEAGLSHDTRVSSDVKEDDDDENANDEKDVIDRGPYVCGAAMTVADLSLYVLLDGLEADAEHAYCAPLATGFVAAFLDASVPGCGGCTTDALGRADPAVERGAVGNRGETIAEPPTNAAPTERRAYVRKTFIKVARLHECVRPFTY